MANKRIILAPSESFQIIQNNKNVGIALVDFLLLLIGAHSMLVWSRFGSIDEAIYKCLGLSTRYNVRYQSGIFFHDEFIFSVDEAVILVFGDYSMCADILQGFGTITTVKKDFCFPNDGSLYTIEYSIQNNKFHVLNHHAVSL